MGIDFITHPRSPTQPASGSSPDSLLRSHPKGVFIVSEKKDISRQRLADFLAARLRARADSQPESQPSRAELSSITSSRPDEHATPTTES
jgi:hypothetical protein